MTDLSKVPDLELRQKVKAVDEAIAKIDADIEEMTAGLYAEREKLSMSREDLLGDRCTTGECAVTGLPIFNDDDTIEEISLACLEDA